MKKFLSLVLALVMAMSLVTISAGAADFTDEASIDPAYAEAVELISALGIVSGNNGAFMPQDNLTRGAAAKILAGVKLGSDLAAKLPKTSAFPDVAAGSTFAGYISYLKDQGIVGGYANGTFGPSNKLTGDAFLKQVLGILGYKADVEGYGVTGWQVSVAIDALNAGLLKGLGADFNSAALITREQAAQIIMNALEANMVEYKNQSSITVGNVVINNTSEATVVANAGADYKAEASDNKMQLVEKAFPTVKKVEKTTDAFMRPATQWTKGGTAIVTFVPAADLTYTAAQACNTVYNALGLTADLVPFIRYINGERSANGNNSAFTATGGKYTGNLGPTVTGTVDTNTLRSYWEVYYNADATDAPKVTLVRIDEYIAKVKSVTAAAGTTKRYVTLETLGTAATDFPVNGTLNYTTEDFAKGDIVTFTYSKKSGATGIVDVKAAECKTGEVTKFQLSGGYKDIFVDDYRINYAFDGGSTLANPDIAIGDTVNVYLDNNGYYLYVKKVTEATKYAYVLKAGTVGGENDWLEGQAADTFKAQLLFMDGTVEIVETSVSVAALENDFVTYTINNKGKYVLTDADSTNITEAGTVATENGKVAVTLNGATKYANNATTFIIKTEKDDEAVYTVYVGYKTVPTYLEGTAFADCIYAANAKAASYIFIDATDLEPAEEALEDLVIVNRHTTGPTLYTDANGSWYQFKAVIDGAVKELNISTDSYAAFDGDIAANIFDQYSIDEDGYYVFDSEDRVAPDANYTGINYVDGLLIVGTGSGAVVYTMDEDVVIAYANGAALSIWTEADLVEDTNDLVYVYDVDDDGLVDYLFIKKA